MNTGSRVDNVVLVHGGFVDGSGWQAVYSLLKADGYNVTTIGRGEEALETMRRRKFDVVLVDLYMSNVSGLDILKSTLEAHKDTIVVVMTGNPSVTSSI